MNIQEIWNAVGKNAAKLAVIGLGYVALPITAMLVTYKMSIYSRSWRTGAVS